MKQRLLVLMLAGLMSVGLTACSFGPTDQTPGTETDNSSLTDNGPGGGAGEDAAAQSRSKKLHRSAWDYLNDGRYKADEKGAVEGRSSLGTDLTQGARDLIRDAKELGKTMSRAGQDAADKARDVMN